MFDHVTKDMKIYKEEIFGPVLSVVRVKSYEEALALVNNHAYGNGTSIYTSDGEISRNFTTNSKIGMVTLYPIINYLEALPVKMFEYMSAGIPVISSNFPLWKEIIEGNNCGLTVDPKDPKQISSAIEKLLSDEKQAEEMGKNGRKAVEEVYNWGIEEKKLLNTYEEILK